MNKTAYINFNGAFYNCDTPIFNSSNRSFRYGDCLFETIHALGTSLQFFDQHYTRLTKGMQVLSMDIPADFKITLEQNIINTINKNRYFGGNRIRLSIFRDSNGLYTPTSNKIAFLIEVSQLEEKQYVLNSKGLHIGLYDEVHKQSTPYTSFKTANAMLFIMAANYKQKKELDDCLLINEEGNIIEAISSNLFIVTNNILQTPAVESGIVQGIMREQIINLALEHNFTVFEDCLLTETDILKADEIFLTNAISGIRWVIAYKQRRYFNKTAKLLIKLLNDKSFGNN